ncbi:MAG: FAD-dependent monooxygenase [Burkholderiaceae bacterium]
MVWPHKVHVIGAGIAGLSFAVALAQMAKAQGHGELSPSQLRIDEAAPGPSSDGAGIQLGPNVVRLLQDQLGLKDVLNTLGFAPKGVSLLNMRSGKRLARLSLDDFEARYGARYLTIHRAALQAALLTRVQKNDHSVNWSRPFAGTSEKPELLVGADGKHSVCRTLHFEHQSQAHKPFYTGQVALRSVLTSLDEVPEPQRHDITVWTGPRHHLVGYPMVMPVKGSMALYYNLVGFIDGQDINTEETGWSRLASTQQVNLLLQALHPSLQWIQPAAGAWSSWPLWASPTMESADDHYRNHVFLIGDSAHAMRPHQAQGSAMAIEDACALARHLTYGSGSLEERCQRAAKERWRRNARVQRQSARNGRIFQLTGPMAWFRDRALQFAGHKLMDQPWLFGGPTES